MKAITITQELKDANVTLFSNNAVGSIKRLNLPTSFVSLNYNAGQLTQGYQTLDNSVHESDGFYDVVIPSYNTATEKLGALFFDVTVFTYPVIALSDEEIQATILEQNQAEQQALVLRNTESSALKTAQIQAQAYTANDDMVNNQALYPLWSGDGAAMVIDEKVQAFENNVLKLWRVVQSHTSQPTWSPPLVPALFTEVAFDGQILAWVQPTGAQDAYPIGGQVTHLGDTWESTINANTTEPQVTVFNYWIKVI